MVRNLIQIAVILVAGILVYNYFFGTNEEKTNSKEVFQKTGTAVKAIWDTVKSEKAKFDAGKYDKVMDQLGGAYKAIRERAKYVDEKVLNRLDELESRKRELESDLDAIERGEQQLQSEPAPTSKKPLSKADQKSAEQTASKIADQARKKEALLRELDSLVRDTNKLLQEAGAE